MRPAYSSRNAWSNPRSTRLPTSRKHPSHRLVHEVLAILEQQRRELEGGAGVASIDEALGCDDRHPSFPEHRTGREIEQQVARAIEQPASEDDARRTVDEVPVVHPPAAHGR